MNCENYIRFIKDWKMLKEINNHNQNYDSSINDYDKWEKNIDETINNCKIFEIEEHIKKLLILSNNPNFNDDLFLPFNEIFLDINFTKEELKNFGINIFSEEIIGIGIRNNTILNENKEEIKVIRFVYCHKFYDESNKIKINYTTISRCQSKDLDKKHKELINNKLKNHYIFKNNTDERNFIFEFIIGFLNLINNPEISYIELKRSEKNYKRRLKHGKYPIPSSSKIIINGELKIYIEKLLSNEKFHYNYKFWVRGHFRTLDSDKYINKKRIWILPYIKGKGILIEKIYKIKDKND